MCALSTNSKTIREVDALRDRCLKSAGIEHRDPTPEANPARKIDVIEVGDIAAAYSDYSIPPTDIDDHTHRQLIERLREAVKAWHKSLPWHMQYLTPKRALTSLVGRILAVVYEWDSNR